ncbi:MAG: extracellular solute-binding protein [Ruminococcus sp.]|nr:extracellular solute-binding protein [Ruminococcus sp.]
MKKRYSKKITSVILSLLMMISLVSCDNDKNKNENSAENTIAEEASSSISLIQNDTHKLYRKTELPYPEGINRVTDILYNEAKDKVFIFGTDDNDNIKCCITDSDFSMYKTAELDVRADSANDNIAFTLSEDTIYAVITKTDFGDASAEDYADYSDYLKNAEYSYSLSAYDFSGNKQFSHKINLTEEYADSDSNLKTITDIGYIDENRLILNIAEKYLIMNTEGEVTGEIIWAESGNISDIVRFSDGRIMCRVSDKNQERFCDFNMETMQFGDYDCSVPISGIMSVGTGGYLAYISNDTAVYGLNTNNTLEKIIDFVSSGFTGLSKVTAIAGGDFICCDGKKIVRLSVRDTEEYAQIEEITLAVAGNYENIKGAVAEFNAESLKYRINVKDYSEGYEYSAEGLNSAVKDLEMDIIAGKIPDMVWLDSNEIYKLSSKGAFADLYSFMENDRVYKKEMFLPNYLEAVETDGKLYSISDTFMIWTIATKADITKTQHWSFDEFTEVYNSLPEGMALFETGNNKEGALSLLTHNCSEFVDYENHTCNFDSPDFIRILEFVNQFPLSRDEFSERKSCRNDTALLESMYIMSFRDINKQKQCLFGEDITFTGYPGDNGAGSMLLLTNQFAILENSSNKQGAWEFIRTFFDDERYGQMDGIPVTESGLEKVMAEALEPPYYFDETMGGQKTFMNEIAHDWSTNQDIKITPMTEEERKRYEEFVRSVNTASSGNFDSVVYKIINEETSAYFAGECTAEKCAQLIQNRVSIMLSEQS